MCALRFTISSVVFYFRTRLYTRHMSHVHRLEYKVSGLPETAEIPADSASGSGVGAAAGAVRPPVPKTEAESVCGGARGRSVRLY